MSARTSAPEPARHWLEPWCRHAAALVALVLTIFRASPSTQWRDDVALVRGLGLVPIGVEGALSSLVTALAALLPVGGRSLRAAWVSALCVALAASCAYLLSRRVLESFAHTPRLTPPLALAAALTATLAPTWQLEGTLSGGAPLAATFVLGALLLCLKESTQTAQKAAILGLLCGALLSESHAAALALLLSFAARGAVLCILPTLRHTALFVGAAVLGSALGITFLLLRPFAPGVDLWFGGGIEASSLSLIDVARVRTTSLGAWLSDVGMIPFALSVAGLGVGLLRASSRKIMVPLAVWVVADMVFASKQVDLLSAEAFACVRLLALVTLGVSASLCVQSSTLALQRAKIPFAEPASVLLVVFTLTLVFVSAEDSGHVANRSAQTGAEMWTDEALGALPPDSLVLTRSEAVAFRIWAAQIVRGERADVVVVPESLLERGNLRSRLLAAEPALAPLIREMALSGRSSEFALSSLADVRPLFVELDPVWNTRLLEHLMPGAFFLRFAPQPLGRSDRRIGSKRGRRALRRVLSATERGPRRDEATRSVLLSRLRERALTLAAVGDRAAALELTTALCSLDPDDELTSALEERLKSTTREKFDLPALLASSGS